MSAQSLDDAYRLRDPLPDWCLQLGLDVPASALLDLSPFMLKLTPALAVISLNELQHI